MVEGGDNCGRGLFLEEGGGLTHCWGDVDGYEEELTDCWGLVLVCQRVAGFVYDFLIASVSEVSGQHLSALDSRSNIHEGVPDTMVSMQ